MIHATNFALAVLGACDKSDIEDSSKHKLQDSEIIATAKKSNS